MAAIAVLATGLPAGAKGAFEVTITGPAVEEPIVLIGSDALEALLTPIRFWDLTYTFADSPFRPDITMEPPTEILGPEFVVTVGHIGPGGDAYVDVFLYPEAEGGPLAYVEPGVEVEAMQEVTSGGWYAVPSDLSLLLEKYGVDMAQAVKSTSLAGSSGAFPVLGWAIPVAFMAALGLWAAGRRPRRPVTS